MNDKELLSEEQLDFLCEMMSIGAGNAATALTQMLRCQVDVKIPMIHELPALQTPSVIGDPSLPAACVRMSLVGNIEGELFFIVPDEQKATLIDLAERAMLGGDGEKQGRREIENEKSSPIFPFPDSLVLGPDLSVLTEIGNILAGVYLTAIHDFCQLNIYHSVPTIAIDMLQSLLDESIITLSRQVQKIILIENEFILEANRIRTFLLVVPAAQSVRLLIDSIERARMVCCEG